MVLCFSVSTVLPLLERPLPGPGALPPDLLEGFEIPRREGDSAFLPSSWPEQGEHLLTPRLAKVGKVANQKLYGKLVAMVSKKEKSFFIPVHKMAKMVKMVRLGFLRGSWQLLFWTRENHPYFETTFLRYSGLSMYRHKRTSKHFGGPPNPSEVLTQVVWGVWS